MQRETLEGMVEGGRGRGRPRVTWTDNIKEWMGNIGGNGGRWKRQGKTKSHMDRQHQGVDGKYWREWWKVEETGEDQESHGQTTSRSGWEILEGMVEGGRDRGRPRVTWTDNIKEWMGNIGGNG